MINLFDKTPFLGFGPIHHRLRLACPEQGRRAQHEREKTRIFKKESLYPELVEWVNKKFIGQVFKGSILTGFTVLIVGISSIVTNGFPSDSTPSGRESNQEDTHIEKLLMEGTEIKGTVEKPHVVYIVPWKEAPSFEQEDISYSRSFMDEIIEPIDRDTFIRHWGTRPTRQKEAN